jgi:hypothetical protein
MLEMGEGNFNAKQVFRFSSKLDYGLDFALFCFFE